MKIKFSIALSIASMIGLQAVEAGEMHCPTFEEVKASQHYDPTTQKYTYEANSKGAKVISFSGYNYRGIENKIVYNTPRVFDRGRQQLECEYLARVSGHHGGGYDINLFSNDKDAIASCKAASKGGDYFECE